MHMANKVCLYKNTQEAVTTSTIGGVKRPDTEHDAKEKAGGYDQQATLRQELEVREADMESWRARAYSLDANPLRF